MQESSEELRSEEELRRVLRTKTDPLAALLQGVRLMGHHFPVGLGFLLVYAAVSTAVASYLRDWSQGLLENPGQDHDVLNSVFLFSFFFLAVYTFIQFLKRDSVTRASWVPALFTVAPLALYGAIRIADSGAANNQIAPLVPGLSILAWDLVWESFAGAVLVFVWIRLGHAAMNGVTADLSEVFADLRRQIVDVAVVHGAKFHAVQIGLQVIIPGIFYALSLAFADMVVVLDPEKPALRRSSQLTYGMRGRIFRLLLVYVLVSMALTLAAFVAIDGTPQGLAGRVVDMMMNPAAPSAATMFARGVIAGLGSWAVTLALLVLFREREGQVRAKRELRDLLKRRETGEATASE